METIEELKELAVALLRLNVKWSPPSHIVSVGKSKAARLHIQAYWPTIECDDLYSTTMPSWS